MAPKKLMKNVWFLLPVLLWLAGCAAPGTKAFTREVSWQAGASNAVAVIQRDIVPFVPAPFGGMVEGAAAVAVAALGMWATSLHKRTSSLEKQASVTAAPPKEG